MVGLLRVVFVVMAFLLMSGLVGGGWPGVFCVFYIVCFVSGAEGVGERGRGEETRDVLVGGEDIFFVLLSS